MVLVAVDLVGFFLKWGGIAHAAHLGGVFFGM